MHWSIAKMTLRPLINPKYFMMESCPLRSHVPSVSENLIVGIRACSMLIQENMPNSAIMTQANSHPA